MNTIYACILAEVETGKAFEAAEYLSSLESVGLVVPTTGPYDLMIIAKSDDPTTLGKIIVSDIQRAPGIHTTLTLLILDRLKPYNWLRQLIAGVT